MTTLGGSIAQTTPIPPLPAGASLMGRLDLLDVYRDEDDFYGSPVDSPCMAREAGDSIVLRATGEPQEPSSDA